MSVFSDHIRFRKMIAGLALIGAPLAGFVYSLTDSTEGLGQSGATLYATAAAHSGRIWAAGLIFIASAILTVPAALGLAHLLRARGAVLGHLGAACLIIGAFGHMGNAAWQLMIARVPGLCLACGGLSGPAAADGQDDVAGFARSGHAGRYGCTPR